MPGSERDTLKYEFYGAAMYSGTGAFGHYKAIVRVRTISADDVGSVVFADGCGLCSAVDRGGI